MGQGCLCYFMVSLDQKAVATKHTNVPFEKLFLIYSENLVTSFFDSRFFRSSSHRRRKLMTYLESWGNAEHETCVFYLKILINIEKMTFFDLTLTWPPSKVWLDDVIWSNDCHHWYLRAKWRRKMCRTAWLWLFMVTFCDLTLTLTFVCKYALRTYAVSFVDIYPAFWVSVQPV